MNVTDAAAIDAAARDRLAELARADLWKPSRLSLIARLAETADPPSGASEAA